MREHGQRDVTLSEWERQAVTEIEAQLRRDVPLVTRLSRRAREIPGWWSALLVALGAAVMFSAALIVHLLVAVAGGVLFAVGLALALLTLTSRIAVWTRQHP